MFCVGCGKEYSEQVNFCSNCGADLTPYHEKNLGSNSSGLSEVFQSPEKKNPIIEPGINNKNPFKDDHTITGSTNNATGSTSENPEESWQDEKKHMKSVISQLEYENQRLWEEKEKLTKTPPRSNIPKKSGLPRPQIKSSESMWNKFKKWYNE